MTFPESKLLGLCSLSKHSFLWLHLRFWKWKLLAFHVQLSLMWVTLDLLKFFVLLLKAIKYYFHLIFNKCLTGFITIDKYDVPGIWKMKKLKIVSKRCVSLPRTEQSQFYQWEILNYLTNSVMIIIKRQHYWCNINGYFFENSFLMFTLMILLSQDLTPLKSTIFGILYS